VVLGDDSNPKVFHTFSRIHGDMERDYNYFQIDACFFSMGSVCFFIVSKVA